MTPKEKRHKYYIKNKEKFNKKPADKKEIENLTYSQTYYSTHKEEQKAKCKEYREIYKKEISQYHKNWRKKNPDYYKKWYKKHKKELAKKYKENISEYNKTKEMYLQGKRWEALRSRIKREISRIIIETLKIDIEIKDFINKGITQREFNEVWFRLSPKDKAFIKLRILHLQSGNIS